LTVERNLIVIIVPAAMHRRATWSCPGAAVPNRLLRPHSHLIVKLRLG